MTRKAPVRNGRAHGNAGLGNEKAPDTCAPGPILSSR